MEIKKEKGEKFKTSFVPLFMGKKSFWCFGYLGFSKKVGV